MALPRTTASTRSPSRSASESVRRTSIPTPSPQPVPSAPSANALHRPSTASPRCLLNSRNAAGVHMTATPPANAVVHSPLRSASQAQCSATSEDEQAVSTVATGPSKPKV